MTALLIIIVAIVLLLIGYVGTAHGWRSSGALTDEKTPAIEKEDGVDYMAAPPAVLWDITFHPSQVQARSRTEFRHLSSDGFPYSYGVLSAVSFSAVAGFWIPVRFDPS